MKISVIDTETVSMKGAICEFGITTFEGEQFLKVESSSGMCVNPKTPISFEAMNVHHITEEDVKDAPEINDVLKDHPLTDSDYVVAHNLSYELAVLPEDYFPENVRKLCTLKLAKLLYPVGEVESHKLGVLYYQWGIYKDPRLQALNIQLHTTSSDTLITGLVLEYMLADNDLTIDQAWELCYDFKTCKGGKKYKSEKWEDIVTKDYDYVQYTFENTELDQEELDYLEELLSEHKHLKEDQLKLCKKSKYLNVPWQTVVEGDIDYSKLPSLASSRYMTAFHRNDEERYQKFKDSLEKGEVTVNAGAVYPYDIIKGLKNSANNEVVANAQWNALPDYLDGSTEKFLPIVDVSGSMSCKVSGNSNLSCLDVATSLGLYLSERNNSVLKNVFMTFSERPEMVKTEGSLKQRLSQMVRSNWGMSTNIQAVFQTLLGVAVEYNVPEEDMPTKLIIVSDMQFNMCMRGDTSVTAFDMMKASYENSGYKLPNIVFWQVNASQGNVPVTVDQSGTALVSGFSPSIMTSLLKGDLSPENVMLDALMKDRYKI